MIFTSIEHQKHEKAIVEKCESLDFTYCKFHVKFRYLHTRITDFSNQHKCYALCKLFPTLNTDSLNSGRYDSIKMLYKILKMKEHSLCSASYSLILHQASKLIA